MKWSSNKTSYLLLCFALLSPEEYMRKSEGSAPGNQIFWNEFLIKSTLQASSRPSVCFFPFIFYIFWTNNIRQELTKLVFESTERVLWEPVGQLFMIAQEDQTGGESLIKVRRSGGKEKSGSVLVVFLFEVSAERVEVSCVHFFWKNERQLSKREAPICCWFMTWQVPSSSSFTSLISKNSWEEKSRQTII